MNNPRPRRGHGINLLANNDTILRGLIILQQLSKNTMHRSNQLALPDPSVDLWKDIQYPPTGGKNPVTAIANHGRIFRDGIVLIDHSKRGDDVCDSDESVLDEPFLEDPWVADFNGDGGDAYFHRSTAEGTPRTGVVDDYLGLVGLRGRVLGGFAGLPCVWCGG
jgi:hypothetical protein